MTRLTLKSLFLAAAATLMQSTPALGSAEEHWYVVTMQDSRIGWMVERSEETEDQIRTETEMNLSIGRGGASVEIRFTSEWIETTENTPVSMRSVQEFGAMPVDILYTFHDDGTITIAREQGGRTNEQTVDAPEAEWLTPAQAGALFTQMLDAGEKTISMTTLDPTTGLQPVTATYHIKEQTTIDAMGKRVPAIECEVEQSMVPGVTTTEFIDREGGVIRVDTNVGGIVMTILRSERELALSPVEPVEMISSSLISPNRPIESARNLRRASYTLRIEDGIMPDFPTSASQRIERVDDRTVRVFVDLDDVAPAPQADIENPTFTGASAMIDTDDPSIAELTHHAISTAGADPMERAEALRGYVYEFIDEKNLGVGFATASEVCRAGEGDCTEHAVLLAAMLRAAGYPSRVASGLIYADAFAGRERIFGYHAWAQALMEVDGQMRWVDLDATLRAGGPAFDATHITLGVSSMAEGETINSMAVLVPLLGQLSIEVDQTD